ncbi:MAG: PleD family two-component system response regulator [Paracoccaceae bacterium]
MPGRILVVDDVATSRLLAKAKLSSAYFDVIEAADGETAHRLACEEQPDLVILDVLMPGPDGFEVCRKLKEDPQTAHIPVVMLTALGNREARMRGLEVGADAFLSKPFEDGALLSRVNSLVRMKMMVDELRLRAATAEELGLDRQPVQIREPDYAASAILLVTRDASFAQTLGAALRASLGCTAEIARGEHETRALVRVNAYDAFIISHDPADGEPLRIASFLRGRPDTRLSATMMLFGERDSFGPAKAMEIGVNDCLHVPPDAEELAARLRVQLRRKYYADQLRKSVQDGLVMAATDPLTRLYNRRYTATHLDGMIDRARRETSPLAAMVLDLDNFKRVNDRFGHASGDRVLVEFARRLQANVRSVDLVARIGGEEFLVVLPDITPDNATRAAERIRNAVETPPFRLEGQSEPLDITVSIGLAMLGTEETGAALVERADHALYASKAGGRNMVTLSAA